ncbi:indole-3-acetic acid-amido synthetase GH3.4-like [Silene latifolia]|uniref:indole-3-acetic acid-amido synthetase GH3.4-like n=1 Tax=Silene latifolia TaxID=37657 RepID=UPI003D777579
MWVLPTTRRGSGWNRFCPDPYHRHSLSQGTLQGDMSGHCDRDLKPDDQGPRRTFTLIPNMAYFEFMPLDSSRSESGSVKCDQPVDLANVEIGKEYELLVTTYTGLYRYRVEDVVCPMSIYNSTPQFKFMGRKHMVLSIDVEETTESGLLKAIENVSIILKPFDTMVLEYTSYAHIKTTIPGHYVIYLELLSKKDPRKIGLTEEVLEQCCLAMENSLNTLYRRCRGLFKSIGPLEIRVVKNGSFEKLREYAISKGTSLSQYKVPRCLKLLPMVQLMDSGVISTHFSPSFPNWGSSDV